MRPLVALHGGVRRKRGISVEVMRAGEQVVDDAGEREHVRRGSHRLTLTALLGCRVAGRADAETREGAAEPFGTRQAEIRDLEDLALAEAAAEHVARREIAMDDPDRMNG